MLALVALVAGTTYQCTVCKHVYDPATDATNAKTTDASCQRPQGTAFEDLPDCWQCPVCGQPKSAYKPQQVDGSTVWVHEHEESDDACGGYHAFCASGYAPCCAPLECAGPNNNACVTPPAAAAPELAGGLHVHEEPAAASQCKKHYAAAGLTVAWNETIAHAMHSMTVQHLRAFNPSATAQNTIPTVDRSVAAFPWTLQAYAPDLPVEASAFATPEMNLIDHILSHMDHGHDGLGKYTSGTERIVHEFHMRDLYARVLQIFEALPVPDAELCACLTDTKANGIEAAMKVYKFVIFETGIHTGEFPRLVGAASWAEGKQVWAPWYEPAALRDVAIYLRCAAGAPGRSKQLLIDDDFHV